MTSSSRNDLNLKIVAFKERYAQDFAKLNYEWLETYFSVEDHDRSMLESPQARIIQPGGQIFFALNRDQVVGTVALIPETEHTFELAKMAVSPSFKGLGIGKRLLQIAVDYSRRAGKKRLILESNTKLTPALNLYISSGFKVIPLNACSPYTRCNIRMELVL